MTWLILCAALVTQHGDVGHTGASAGGGALAGTATGDIDMGGYLLTDTTQVLEFGTACTTSHSLVAGDICIGGSGKLEVDGLSYFDAASYFSDILEFSFQVRGTDDARMFLGTGLDAVLKWNTSTTPDSLFLGLRDSYVMYIGDLNDLTAAFTYPGQTDPTLVIQSSDATSEDERLIFRYDSGTKAVIRAGTGYINMGTDAVSNRGIGTGGVLYGGKVEYDAQVYYDQIVTYYNNSFTGDNVGQYYGASNDASIRWMNSTQTNAGMMQTVGALSRYFMFVEEGDTSTNFGKANQTNPTVFIQSANQADTAEWISMKHDQTDAVIESGQGDIKLDPAGGDVVIDGDLTVATYTVNQFVQIGGAILGPTAPARDTNASCAGLAFSADAHLADGLWEIPSCWDGTDITVEVYWCNESGDAVADTETVIFNLHYRSVTWGTEGADNGTLATKVGTHTQSGAGGAADTFETAITLPFNDANQPLTAADHVMFEFDRDVTGDTYTGGAIVIGIEFEFQCTGLVDHM